MASKPNQLWNDLDPNERAFVKKLGVPMETMPSCPPPDLLRALQEAEALPQQMRRRIEAHIQNCPVCQILARDLDGLDAPLSPEEDNRIHARVFDAVPGRARLPKWRLFWPLIPAGGVAVLLFAWLLTHFGRTNYRRKAASSPLAGPTMAVKEGVFALEKPAAALGVPLLMRGASSGRQRYLADLSLALAPYQSGDYAKAIRRLQLLTKKYPQSARVPFYLGVSRLLKGDNAAAAPSLKRAVALAHGPFSEECRWYLALANVRSGQAAEAATILESLCRSSGAYAARSCAGLKALSMPGQPIRSR